MIILASYEPAVLMFFIAFYSKRSLCLRVLIYPTTATRAINTSDYSLNFSSETNNITSHWNGFNVPRNLQIAMTTTYVITFVTALLGNVLVIHAVVHYQHMRTTTNVLITNMAMADLLTTMLAMPYSVIYLFIQGRWFGGVFGTLLCKVVHFVIAVTIAASIIALFLVSLERFCAVVYPLKYIHVIHNKTLLSLIVWIASAVFMFVYLVVYRVSSFQDNIHLCQLVWGPEFHVTRSPKIFYLLVLFLLYVLPLLAIAFMHTIIVRRLWRRQVPGNLLELNRKAALRSRQSVMKMLAVVLVVFTLCWLPVHIMHIFINFHYSRFKQLPPWVVMIGFWISHANSAINPYIFITMNQSFKKIALGVLAKCISCIDTGPKLLRRVSTGVFTGRFFISDFQGYSLADNTSPSAQCESPLALLKTFNNMASHGVPESPTGRHGNASRESRL
ncbi:hypothetical protein QZH41_012931 [Actinostola sp. cb2023]|nr:hypothetical protein QZH41_012931 [Actinostola sp. cb2023]